MVRRSIKVIREYYHEALILLFAFCMMGISSKLMAADLLAGTTDDLVNTLNGSGKTYLYIAEGILSLAVYIKTKNLLVLGGIVVVSIFFNIMMKVAGI